MKRLLLFICISFFIQNVFSQKIFFGAEGFGTERRGAYQTTDNPTILTVNTLEAGIVQTGTHSGSFEWCITRSYPRIILFSIGGEIDYRGIKEQLFINQPYCNIYGQTAPYPGITIHGADLTVVSAGHDCLIQHIRSRPGDRDDYGDLGIRDAISVRADNVVIDHCSVSWATDEVVALSPGASNVTVSNCLIAYPFDETLNNQQKGALICADSNTTWMRNLIAFNRDRSPSVCSDKLVCINNMNYIEKFICSPRIWFTEPHPPVKQAYVGNYWELSPSRRDEWMKPTAKIYNTVDPASLIYFEGNSSPMSRDNPGNTEYENVVYELTMPHPEKSPLDLSGYTIMPAEDVEEYIMQNVGAFYWQRDPFDIYVLERLAARAEGLAETYTDLPSQFLEPLETAEITLDIPADPHGDDNGDGYTNLEEWVAGFGSAGYKSVVFEVRNSSNNVPVSGATVELAGFATGTTNTTGTATFTNIPEGNSYNYTISKPGYFSDNANITVSSNMTVNISLTQDIDVTPPSAPQNLAGSPVSSTQVNLTWNAATDNKGIAGYIIYRNNSQIGSTSGLSYSDQSAPAGTQSEYAVSAYDLSYNEGDKSDPIYIITFANTDTEAPSIPGNLNSTAVTTTSVTLSWSASADNIEVIGYNVYRNSVYIGTTSSPGYVDDGLVPDSEYTYRVSSFDEAGNESGLSTSLSVTTAANIDAESPSIPDDLLAQALSPTEVFISWSASSDNIGVVGYNIYRDGSILAVTTDLAYSDLEVLQETEYAYSVTAWDQAGNESGMSESILIETPAPQKVTYINPESNSLLAPNGSLEAPYTSWAQITFQEGWEYRQMRNTVAYEPKILITANNIKIGAYGTGERPQIITTANDYAISAYEKSRITISELDIRADGALGGIYFAGTESDSNIVEKSKITGGEYSLRIVGGENFIIRYNELDANSNAIYSIATHSMIYYNEIVNSNVGINIGDYSSASEIYNNVFFSNLNAVSSSYGQLTLYNNIFSLDLPGSMAINQSLDSIISDHNIFYPVRPSFVRIGNQTYDNLGTYQDDRQLDLHSKNEDPRFINAEFGDFRVDDFSPAIESGIDIGLEEDILGSAVPYGNYPDIGIQETEQLLRLINNREANQNQIGIYPNPSDGIFTMELLNEQADASFDIRIVDMKGNNVYNEQGITGNYHQFSLNYLLPGQYILIANAGARTYSNVLIIK